MVARDLTIAFMVCNNVTPVYPDADDDTRKEFQASSPDEIALVKFGEELGIEMIDRDEKLITLKNPTGSKVLYEHYEILKDFPFTSESKRMGIILRHRETNKIMFYVKGADVVMIEKVKPT